MWINNADLSKPIATSDKTFNFKINSQEKNNQNLPDLY
jgi:hypothetical protein